LLFPLFTGCGGGGAKFATEFVEGIVTLDGAPLEGAVVSFSPKGSGKFASGRTDSSGRYTLTATQGGGNGKGTTPDDYIVLIVKNEAVPLAEPEKDEDGNPRLDASGNPITTRIANVLPVVYNNVDTSKLTATVVAGKNKCDFALSSTEK